MWTAEIKLNGEWPLQSRNYAIKEIAIKPEKKPRNFRV